MHQPTAGLKPLKAPHCGALWARGGRNRPPLFILLYFRTGRQPQKSGQKVMRTEASNDYSMAVLSLLFSALKGRRQRRGGGSGYCPPSKIAHSGSHGQTGFVYDEGGVSTLILRYAPPKRWTARDQEGVLCCLTHSAHRLPKQAESPVFRLVSASAVVPRLASGRS